MLLQALPLAPLPQRPSSWRVEVRLELTTHTAPPTQVSSVPACSAVQCSGCFAAAKTIRRGRVTGGERLVQAAAEASSQWSAMSNGGRGKELAIEAQRAAATLLQCRCGWVGAGRMGQQEEKPPISKVSVGPLQTARSRAANCLRPF